jgi:site-specific DNA recombinase
MVTKRFDDEQIALKKKISALQAEIDMEEKHTHSAAAFLRTVKKHTGIQEFTSLILDKLAEKIAVHQAQGVGENRSQQLEIHYNFIGVLDTQRLPPCPKAL